MSDGFHAATGGSSPLLAVEGLTKVYPTGKKALGGIDVVIDRPQLVAVIGSSGAGKSTFIRCINRLVEPTAGRILLNGEDIVALDRKGLRATRRRIGMIFQEYNLVERLSVMQNVLSGSRLILAIEDEPSSLKPSSPSTVRVTVVLRT